MRRRKTQQQIRDERAGTYEDIALLEDLGFYNVPHGDRPICPDLPRIINIRGVWVKDHRRCFGCASCDMPNEFVKEVKA